MKNSTVLFIISMLIITNFFTGFFINKISKENFKQELIKVLDNKEKRLLKRINTAKPTIYRTHNQICFNGLNLSDDIETKKELSNEILSRIELAIILEGEFPSSFKVANYEYKQAEQELLVSIVKKDIHDTTVTFAGRSYLFEKSNENLILKKIIGEQ